MSFMPASAASVAWVARTADRPPAISCRLATKTPEMRAAITTSGGRQYLGAQSLSGSGGMQPVIGPLGGGGLQLVYRDQAGATTTVPAEVRTIDLTVRSQSYRPVTTLGGGVGAMLRDSLALRVLLRNAR